MVIPGLVNTIIALFKDTSLVIIIGLFDLFSSVQQATVDPEWVRYVDGRLRFLPHWSTGFSVLACRATASIWRSALTPGVHHTEDHHE
nr:hypothetical protein [Pseudescherichia vulneris]